MIRSYRAPLVAALALTAALTAGVAAHSAAPPDQTAPEPAAVTSTAPPGTAGQSTIAQLTIDDHPHNNSGYRRDEWPHWLDTDHDGCDARNQALVAASTVPPVVVASCKVTAGGWFSDYDGTETSRPGDEDVDHVVPLAEAYRSGGWSWSTARRTEYANDQADLWVVSAKSNRAKGDQPPNEWRPPRHESWCTYARRWTDIKVRWGLTATTAERDALGQMMEAC